MKVISLISILILSLVSIFIFSSCSKDEDPPIDLPTSDCVFVQNDDDMDSRIDETEGSIIAACLNNKLTEVSEIKSNLVGEWNIIGHGEGWLPTNSQPCGKVVFTESEFTFDFHSRYIDTIYTGKWDIVIDENGGNLLDLNGTKAFTLSSISIFCEDHMYFDHTSFDGDMYLYEKK